MQDTREVSERMAALEAAIALVQLAYSEEDKFTPELNRAFNAIDPTNWSRRIETSLDNAPYLKSTRKDFDNKTLLFISAFLNYGHVKRQTVAAEDGLDEQIRAMVDLVDSPSSHWLPYNFKSAMKEVVLRGIDLIYSRRTEVKINASDVLGDTTGGYAILSSTYLILAAALVELSKQVPNYQYYREHGGVRPYLTGEISLDGSYRVPFLDCLNSVHPANVKLEEAHTALTNSWKRVRDLQLKLSGRTFSPTSEHEHGTRLLNILHDEGDGNAAKIKVILNEQNTRRVAYEGDRIRLFIAVDDLKVRYDELFYALIAAGEETTTLLGEIKTEAYFTGKDRRNTLRIAMNNCLAADRDLRKVNRAINEHINQQSKDLSLGTGAAAINESYERRAKNYVMGKASSIFQR